MTDTHTHDDGIYRASIASRGRNWSYDVITPLSGTVDWDYLRSACISNFQSLRPVTPKIRKATKTAEIGVVWGVRGHPKSSAT